MDRHFDRHFFFCWQLNKQDAWDPKIREGVMIGAGAKVLGNIEVGRGAKIGAGSVDAAAGTSSYHGGGCASSRSGPS